MTIGFHRIRAGCAALMLAFAFAAAAPCAHAEDLRLVPWYGLTLKGGGLGRTVDHVYLFARAQRLESGRPEFWVVERVLNDVHPGPGGSKTSHDWIDGRTCAALAPVLDHISKTPPTTFETADRDIDVRPPSDVPAFRISGPDGGADVVGGARVARSEYLGRESRWWDSASKTLDSCWRKAPVLANAVAFEPFLSNTSDIAYWSGW